jgi:hypothetical protein
LSNGTLAAIKPVIYKSDAKLNGEKEKMRGTKHDTAHTTSKLEF